MKYKNFREFKIIRTCEREYKSYNSYRKVLKKDFHNRCAYCNTYDYILEPLTYAIDHYVPKAIFKDKDKTLDYNYNNLMYTCPKCNSEKKDKYYIEESSGNLEIKNSLFYNPVEVDYNEIFYRDELGSIQSEDKKGKEMIALLKLYRPLYNFAWLLEELHYINEKINNKLREDSLSIEAREKFETALNKINSYYIEMDKLFKKSYKMK